MLLPGSALAAPVALFAAPAATGTGDCLSPANACALAGASGALTRAASGANSGSDVTIDLAAGTYLPIAINAGSEHTLTLDGAGTATTMLSGGASAETVSITETFAVTLENLAITDGSMPSGDGGNVAIASGANVTITDAAITGGTAEHGGGLMIVGASTVTVRDSTVSGNTATTAGGGIDLQSTAGTLNLLDSTVTASVGGALLSDGIANVYGSTISGNDSGLEIAGGALDLGASLLSNNATHDCATGSPTDEGYNYADDTTCSGFGATSHASATPPLNVGPLGSFGGPTQTMQITNSSAAYDVVPLATTPTGDPDGAFCSGADQRGVPRTQGAATACDAGAYQYAPPVVTGVSPAAALELGLPLTLSGAGFGNLTAVRFGETAATITALTNTSLSLVVPLALAFGSQPITLVNPDSHGGVAVAFTALANPGIAAIALPPAQLGVAYSQTVPVGGGRAPFTYQMLSGALPAGLTLSSAGVVSGTPTKSGGSAFTLSATDANGIGSPSETLSLIVATPIVEIKSTTIKLIGRDAPVLLACKFAPCVGTVKLIEYVEIKKRKTAVTLGSATYSLAAAASGTEQMILLANGVHALAHVKKHRLTEAVTASAHGGETAVTPVVIS
jgi:hypothetical protein